MLNIDEINKEIDKLENCSCTTYSICQKLANLYIVREYYKGGKVEDKTPVTNTKMKPSASIEPTAAKEL